jgi:hypothetical protein
VSLVSAQTAPRSIAHRWHRWKRRQGDPNDGAQLATASIKRPATLASGPVRPQAVKCQ